jgi:hypothetical protein
MQVDIGPVKKSQARNPSPWEKEAGNWEFEASLDYKVRPCLKNKQTNKKLGLFIMNEWEDGYGGLTQKTSRGVEPVGIALHTVPSLALGADRHLVPTTQAHRFYCCSFL